MWFQQIHQFAAFVAVYPFFAFSLSDVESSSSASSAVFKSSSVSSHDQMTGVAHRKDGMRPNPVFWRYYLTPHNKEYLYPQKRADAVKSCRPILTAISTYTHGRGIQQPTVVFTARCQGGIKNPENYQCQPSLMLIECFHLQNELGDDDYLGLYSHEACQERCICGRKSCKNKQIHNLICPLGFQEDKKTCQCSSVVGQTIFYRSPGMIADWDKNLHRLCRTNSVNHPTKVGQSFKLKVI